MARFNRFGKVRLHHKAAARAVDDAYAFFHRRDRLCVDNVLGLLGERGVKGDEIGAAEEFFEADALHAEVDCALVGKEWVIADDLHSEAVRAVGDDGADVAATDDAERLGCHLDAHAPLDDLADLFIARPRRISAAALSPSPECKLYDLVAKVFRIRNAGRLLDLRQLLVEKLPVHAVYRWVEVQG